MKKLILATVAISALSIGGAFAQTTGPSGQDTGKTTMQPESGMSKNSNGVNTNMNKGVTTGSSSMQRQGTNSMQREGTGESPSINENNGTRSPAASGDAGNGGGQ